MKTLYKHGVGLPWPEGLVEHALSCGWTLPEERTQEPELQLIATPCPEGFVEIMLPNGTKETASCLKTPEWLGAERWFTKTRLHSYWWDGEHWMVQLSPEELKKRKLSHLLEVA